MVDESDTPYETPIFDDSDEVTQVVAALEYGGFFGDRFRVDHGLGVGAMGRVVTALDMRTGAKVALKVLHHERARNVEYVKRFRREAEVLASLGHPAIVRFIAFDRAPDGTHWMALEFLEGETLKARIQRRRYEPVEAWPVVATVCDALYAAHRVGVVHRDLKPDNLYLPGSGAPPAKILDFGLSTAGHLDAEKLTRKGTLLGTPRYMAPEFLHSALQVGPPADVFSLGAVLFEMLAGQSIYAADDMAQLMGAIFEGRTKKLRELRPELGQPLSDVIEQATAKDPNERFASADAFANAFAATVGVSAARDVFLEVASSGQPRSPLVSPSTRPPTAFEASPFAPGGGTFPPSMRAPEASFGGSSMSGSSVPGPSMPGSSVSGSSVSGSSMPGSSMPGSSMSPGGPPALASSSSPGGPSPLTGSASSSMSEAIPPTTAPGRVSDPGRAGARVLEFTRPDPTAPRSSSRSSRSPRETPSAPPPKPAVWPYVILAIFVLVACAGGSFLALELLTGAG